MRGKNMNDLVIKRVAQQVGVSTNQVAVVNEMLNDGATIPFISRYRKEATGGLDEVQVKAIYDVHQYEKNLFERKESVINLIDEKGLLTPELKSQILAAKKMVDVEDMYRPFKEKKKTKATEAIALGLEPLAKKLMSFPEGVRLTELATPYVNKDVVNVELALRGAGYIISEWVSDNANFRNYIRDFIFKNGVVVTKVKKAHENTDNKYDIYHDFRGNLKAIKGHQTLAINRAIKEKIISFKIEVDEARIISWLSKKSIRPGNQAITTLVESAIADSYKRLIFPSIERELWSEALAKAEEGAINIFSKNLYQLLMTPPIKGKTVLGFDPAFRTGCKLAIVSPEGKLGKIEVIYPHHPQNQVEQSKTKLIDLIKKFKVDVVAIGNGTASRESEEFVAKTIKEANLDAKYIIISEAGASVYSASAVAQKEFPDLQVEQRSAVSIARRLQEPLAELIKIDPKSIGVGQYQHDVNQKMLSSELDFVVESAVNNVGVNINTASPELLTHVSGLSAKVAENVVLLRDEIGKFNSRTEIKKVKGMGPKAYEQAAGFLRILDGKNPLDKTPIHPESYKQAKTLMEKMKISVNQLGSKDVIDKCNAAKFENFTELKIDKYTFELLIESFKKPLQDPRDDVDEPIFRSDVLTIEELQEGMEVAGVVRNITDFGAFIDIGLKNDGLAHISKLKKGFVKHPLEVVSVGQKVKCWIIEVDLNRKQTKLTLVDPKTN